MGVAISRTLFPNGVVCKQDFSRAEPRLLFILKEPNDHHEDIRTHARNVPWSYATWRNLAYWSRGILDGFPQFQRILSEPEANRAALKKAAVINVKKTPGKAFAMYREIDA